MRDGINEKFRTQNHMRWCGYMHDSINEKVRTQDHMRWYGYKTTSAGRSGPTSRICARVCCVETGTVFTLAKFGKEAGSLVKVRWLGVTQIADLMKGT